jgi:hypothetical protein
LRAKPEAITVAAQMTSRECVVNMRCSLLAPSLSTKYTDVDDHTCLSPSKAYFACKSTHHGRIWPARSTMMPHICPIASSLNILLFNWAVKRTFPRLPFRLTVLSLQPMTIAICGGAMRCLRMNSKREFNLLQLFRCNHCRSIKSPFQPRGPIRFLQNYARLWMQRLWLIPTRKD